MHFSFCSWLYENIIDNTVNSLLTDLVKVEDAPPPVREGFWLIRAQTNGFINDFGAQSADFVILGSNME